MAPYRTLLLRFSGNQWKTFVRKLGRDDIPIDIDPVMKRLHQFFDPIISSLTDKKYEHGITRWDPEGGWST